MRTSNLLGAGFVAVWSSGYVVGSLATRHAPALAVTTWRMALAGLLLGAVATAARVRWPQTVRAWAAIAGVGALLCGVQFGGIYLGIAKGMPAGTAALLASSCPVLVAVVQVAAGAERLGGRQWLGAALGMTGVVLALLPRLAAPGSVVALAWTLLGLVGLTAGTLLTPRLVPRDVDVRAVAAIECVTGALVLLPWALLTGGIGFRLTPATVFDTGWLWLVNSVGGSMLLLALVRARGATRATSLLFAVPAVTALAAWPVLGQSIEISTVLGLAVATAGIALVQRGSAPSEKTGGSRRRAPGVLAPTMGR